MQIFEQFEFRFDFANMFVFLNKTGLRSIVVLVGLCDPILSYMLWRMFVPLLASPAAGRVTETWVGMPGRQEAMMEVRMVASGRKQEDTMDVRMVDRGSNA